MNQDKIDIFLKNKRIRIRNFDKERIKALIVSSDSNANAASSILKINNTATIIFREIYESIRQLGDAFWWLLGYEPQDHEISLEILKELKIEQNVKLNFLDRFRKIRNDANYRGFKVSLLQAEEILDFWNRAGREIINLLNKKLL